MKWNKITSHFSRDQLPKDKQFIALWKGVTCIAEYCDDEDLFFISFYPSQFESVMKVCRDREEKFTHWIDIVLPEDY